MTNLLFRNALNRLPQATPPIWFMRQAGRYHSHYQALKKNHTFEELCKNPELAAETALGPINDFDFDVSILFSDILFPLEALGMGLKYDPGPIFNKFINPNNKINRNRQEFKEKYYLCGIFYISKIKSYLKNQSFMQSKTGFTEVNDEKIIEIDDNFDLKLARLLK